MSYLDVRSPTLRELANAAVGGDRAAIEALMVAVHTMVYRYCRARLMRSGADNAAQDVAQEVCIAVLTALPRYRDEGKPFEAFVYRIAANKVADARRAGYRSAVLIEEIPDSRDHSAGPEDLAVIADETRRAKVLLDALPAQQREIVFLRVAAGLSAEETGRALGMSAGAVRVSQHRALQRLRSMVDQRVGGTA